MTRSERRAVWFAKVKRDPARLAHYRAKRKEYDRTYKKRHPEKWEEVQKRAREKYLAKEKPVPEGQLIGERIERVGNRTIHRLLDDEAIS